jgi:hypothetical protein
MEHPSQGTGVEGVVYRNPTNGSVNIVGRITGLGLQPQRISWIAAAHVTRGLGFSGSGMPYPNRTIAFENTPHRGVVDSNDGSFNITLGAIPAGYFSGLGSVYVPPLVEFTSVTRDGKRLQANLWVNDNVAPWRWISGSPATLRPEAVNVEATGRAMYYAGRDDLPLFDNQEAQLRARAYPSDMAARGWADTDDARPFSHVPSPA